MENNGQSHIPGMLELGDVMKIAKRLEKGESALSLSKEYKVPYLAILKVRKQYTDLSSVSEYSHSFKEQVLDLIGEGKSAREIADEKKISTTTVHRWARENGAIIKSNPKRRTYTRDFKLSLLQEIKEGATYEGLQAKYGIAHQTIRTWAVKEGIYAPDQRSKFPKDYPDKAVKMFHEGISPVEIAKNLGCTDKSVYRWLKNAGVKLNYEHEIDPVKYKKTIKLHEQGYPIADIVKLLNSNYPTVNRYIKMHDEA